MKGHLKEALIDELAEAAPEAELTPAVAEHLESCPLCQEELTLARMVNDALEAVPGLEAPPELLGGVMEGVAEKSRRMRRRSIAGAAMAGLMALTVVLLWLVAGGAAALVVEALEALRSIEMVTRIVTSIWRTIPLELFTLCAAVMLASSALLSRLVTRIARRPDAAVEAG